GRRRVQTGPRHSPSRSKWHAERRYSAPLSSVHLFSVHPSLETPREPVGARVSPRMPLRKGRKWPIRPSTVQMENSALPSPKVLAGSAKNGLRRNRRSFGGQLRLSKRLWAVSDRPPELSKPQ